MEAERSYPIQSHQNPDSLEQTLSKLHLAHAWVRHNARMIQAQQRQLSQCSSTLAGNGSRLSGLSQDLLRLDDQFRRLEHQCGQVKADPSL